MNLACDILQSLEEKRTIVKLVADLLNSGNWQIVDMGMHGWFHLYSAVRRHRMGRNEIVKLKHYKPNMSPPLHEPDDVASGKMASKMALGATKALTKLGMKKQRATVVIYDLSNLKNQVTGGGVGGFADFKRHGLAADRNIVLGNPKFAIELLAHEWGHAQQNRMPKAQREYIRDWYQKNVLGKAIATAKITNAMKKEASEIVMSRVNIQWEKRWPGRMLLANLADLFAEVKGKGNTPEPLDILARVGARIQGRMKKKLVTDSNVTDPDTGAESKFVFQKGDQVELVASVERATPIDQWDAWLMTGPFRRKTKRQLMNKMQKITLGQARDLMDIDINLTLGKVKKKVKLGDTQMTADQFEFVMEVLTSPDFRTFGEWVGSTRRGSGVGSPPGGYNRLIDAFEEVALALQKSTVVERIPFELFVLDVVDAYVDKATKMGHAFSHHEDGAKAILHTIQWGDEIFAKNKAAPPASLDTPLFTWFRRQAKDNSLTPSSYAAANDRELWADTVAYAAVRMNEVPKEVLKMMRAVIQGKTRNESRWVIDALEGLLA
jgi:hypothetical protein